MSAEPPTSRPQRGRAYWLEHVNQWKATGIKQSDYCREHRLSERLFSVWKNRFIKEEQTDASSGPDFLPVTTKTVAAVACSDDITVHLPNGIYLKVGLSSPGQSVAELAKYLVALAC